MAFHEAGTFPALINKRCKAQETLSRYFPTPRSSRAGLWKNSNCRLALEEASEVLKAYMFQRQQITFLEESVALYYDPISDRVFLEDGQWNVAMKNENGDLKQWATCRVCGVEEFREAHEPKFVDDATCVQCSLQGE